MYFNLVHKIKKLLFDLKKPTLFQLTDREFEVSQLRSTVEDYEKLLNESESKYKCEIAKLKNKNQELQFSLEEIHKERNNGTPKLNMPSTSQTTSYNGDLLSEVGSLVSGFIFKIKYVIKLILN